MSEKEFPAAYAALRKIQILWTLNEKDWIVRKLGGLTNQLYYVSLAGEQYVLRIPAPGAETYLDYPHEYACTKQAARVGVSPDLIYFDEKTGVGVSRFIDDSVTLTPVQFQSEPDARLRALHLLQRLHQSDADFYKNFDYLGWLEQYLDILTKKQIAWPKGYAALVAQTKKIQQVLDQSSLPRVPIHGETVCENFINTPLRLWLVDWEYAGMGDPLWDVAQFAVEAELSTAQELKFLSDYLQHEPDQSELARFKIYQFLSDVLWTAWALVQPQDDNLAKDFSAHAARRCERAQALVVEHNYDELIKQVKS